MGGGGDEKQKCLTFILLSGHSAGSHLCAMALSSKWFESLPKPVQQSVSGIIHLSG